MNRDRNQGSIKLIRVEDKSVAWAGASGDKSVWWGAMKSGGQAKVSNRLARKLKKDYFNEKYNFVRKEKKETKEKEEPKEDESSGFKETPAGLNTAPCSEWASER